MSQPKIVVVGSFIADYTVFAPVFPRAGETVLGGKFRTGPGGKGSNQATAAHRAGGDVTMVTKIGCDNAAAVALEHYGREKMSTEFVFRTDAADTGVAVIEVCEEQGENRIIVIKGANGKLTRGEVRRAEGRIAEADVLLLQLEASLEAANEAMKLARKHGTRIVMNPAPAQKVPVGFFEGVDYFTPNETEAEFFSGMPTGTLEQAKAAAKKLMELGIGQVVMTLGESGALHVSESCAELVPTVNVTAVDTTGAGDAFNGGFCVALAEFGEARVREAIEFANCTAALSVTRPGSSPSMPFRSEIEALVKKTRC